MARRDGREAAQLREMNCELAVLERADGSARFHQGKTRVLAAIFGPREVPVRHELADRCTVQVEWKSQTGQHSVGDTRLAGVIQQAVTASILTHVHPRSLVSVVVHVEADDGALLACAMNAASLALLDAGVPMQQTIIAAACALHSGGARPLVLDPLRRESETSGVATVSAAMGRAQGREPRLLAMQLDGACGEEELTGALDMISASTDTVEVFFRKALERRYSKEGRL